MYTHRPDRQSGSPRRIRLVALAGSNASDVLVSALPPILRAPGFLKELRHDFEERLRLAAWDADQCWKELERICAEGVGKHDSSDVDFGHASRVVEALARKGEGYVDRTLDLLGQKVEDFETDPMTWLEIFLVMLAGEMRLERAISPARNKADSHGWRQSGNQARSAHPFRLHKLPWRWRWPCPCGWQRR